MRKISSRFLPVLAAVVTVALSGCTSFKYVGQTFPETPYSVPVPMITGKKAIPAGTYAIIGRGVLYSRNNLDQYDLEEALADEARARGADAFCVLGTQVIRIGTFGYEDDSFMSPLEPADTSETGFLPDGSPNENSRYGDGTVEFGPPLDMRQVHYRREFQTRVLLLKERGKLAELLKERDARSTRERRTVDLPPGPETPDVRKEIPKPDGTMPIRPETNREGEGEELNAQRVLTAADALVAPVPASPETPPAPQK